MFRASGAATSCIGGPRTYGGQTVARSKLDIMSELGLVARSTWKSRSLRLCLLDKLPGRSFGQRFTRAIPMHPPSIASFFVDRVDRLLIPISFHKSCRPRFAIFNLRRERTCYDQTLDFGRFGRCLQNRLCPSNGWFDEIVRFADVPVERRRTMYDCTSVVQHV